MEEVIMLLDEAKSLMEKALQHVNGELAKIRAGKATTSMLDSIRVQYYGNATPLNQVASLSTPDARSIFIKPWEKSLVSEIERSIINSDLGLNPHNDGEQIIINIPILTEERRVQLVKQAKHEGEQGKISIRNARHEVLHSIKALKDEGIAEDEIRKGEEKIDELTSTYTKKIDDLIANKETDILHV
ncbi:MAG TPA: ribosome recycling factor [Cyclobacteriaceae bacterium]|jgi:ribosome recycling factor